jgi:ribonuclease BN (tRNA processing enzyme)
MKLTFIGAGNGLSKTRFNTNALLVFNNTNLLIDCGRTSIEALDCCDIRISDVENIAITHLHSDHIGGLESVAYLTRYMIKSKINLYTPQTLIMQLWQESLKGGLGHCEGKQMELEDYFNIGKVVPVDQGEKIIKYMHNWFEIAGEKFKFIKTEHVKGMRSYGIWCPGKFLYTGDSRFNREFIESMAGSVRVIFHECQSLMSDVHTSIDELITLPEDIKRKIVLMHYDDDLPYCERKIKQFKGIAQQGEEYEI